MSTTNAAAYCEPDDVQAALTETDAKFAESPYETPNVEAAIYSVSRWLRSRANAHWYDSNAAADDLISSEPVTTSDRTLDVPSSPHPQQGQTMRTAKRAGTNVRYPKTHAGPFARVQLPVNHVETIDSLEVRDRSGELSDWVAGSEVEGRGEDYYIQTEGDGRGKSYLYVNAGSLGAHHDFTDLLRVELSYGKDWDTDPWDDVRRGVAALAGAQLVVDDDLVSSIAEQGVVVGVETRAQQLVNQAFTEPGYLSPFMTDPVR